MPSCLGLYIESNLIKYAKVSKERDNIKVESFGIKFYDRLGEAIRQIVSETYSYKIPISINLAEETYNYFYMFSLLNRKDLKKAVGTEFDSYCFDKGINRNALETRYALVNSLEDKEKVKVIHVSSNKNSINMLEQQLEGVKPSAIFPLGTSIANVADIKPKENIMIVNMEEKTTLTTIVDQKVYNVEIVDLGSKDVLSEIAAKENSYAKAYEICKNSTIYTMEGKELQEDENQYLDNIMPTLYKIVTKVKEEIENNTIDISKVYITGNLSVVNNIDLYFQEFLGKIKCEIMKPYFIKDTLKISIKDYIEVNSAIALALQGLDYGIKGMNFKKTTFSENMSNAFRIETNGKDKKMKDVSIDLSKIFKFDLHERMTATERWMLRTATGILTLIIIYSAFSIFLKNEIGKKEQEVANVKTDTNLQLQMVDNDINAVKTKTNKYIQLSENLENISEQIMENNKNKNNIPTLLTKIMFAMPQDVQITSIENTTGKHIVINAQSKRYDQLGIFKVTLREQGILLPNTIVSSTGEKTGDYVKVVIEGDMP